MLQALRQSMITTESKMRSSTGSQVGVWVAAFNQVDADEMDYEELLKKIRELKLPLIMFRSKSGRAHVYLFMKNFTLKLKNFCLKIIMLAFQSHKVMFTEKKNGP